MKPLNTSPAKLIHGTQNRLLVEHFLVEGFPQKYLNSGLSLIEADFPDIWLQSRLQARMHLKLLWHQPSTKVVCCFSLGCIFSAHSHRHLLGVVGSIFGNPQAEPSSPWKFLLHMSPVIIWYYVISIYPFWTQIPDPCNHETIFFWRSWEHFSRSHFQNTRARPHPACPGSSWPLPPQSLAKVGESGGSQKTFGSIDVDPFHQGDDGRGKKKHPKLFARFFLG